MLSFKELLELKKQIKSRKPHFIRQDTHKKKKLSRKWRRPKGLHSKIRLKLRGRSKSVSMGYRSPRKVRYLHKSGLQQHIVRSISDLKGLDAKKIYLIISSSLGDRKKITILKKVKEQGFNNLNIIDPEGYIKKVEDRINLRKKIKKEKREKAKETTKGDKEVKKEKGDQKLSEKINEDLGKDIEKKEKDKFLTKRS